MAQRGNIFMIYDIIWYEKAGWGDKWVQLLPDTGAGAAGGMAYSRSWVEMIPSYIRVPLHPRNLIYSCSHILISSYPQDWKISSRLKDMPFSQFSKDIKMYNWLDVRVAVCGALPVTCLELINHSLTPPLCLVPWTPWSDISSRKFSLNTTFPTQAWHMPSRLSG